LKEAEGSRPMKPLGGKKKAGEDLLRGGKGIEEGNLSGRRGEAWIKQREGASRIRKERH